MPKLSVVVVSHDMARELPRTLRSLSPSMQRGIAAEDYEIIVVDNGSPVPPDEEQLRRAGGPVSLHRVPDPTPSPSRAVNHGLALARGRLVGVFVDGARLASPGLLGAALRASRLSERPVVGTLSYHLGPDLQRRSMAAGYDREREDALLAASGWEQDGYRLFSISVLAGSSSRGWFALPVESNALFLTREHWQALGGYDERFRSPGGGLVNLDTWARACADAADGVVLLLGEATFHQLHGGVSTNAPKESWEEPFRREYLEIRGQPFRRPEGLPVLVGSLQPAAIESLRASLQPARPAAAPDARGPRAGLGNLLSRWLGRVRPA